MEQQTLAKYAEDKLLAYITDSNMKAGEKLPAEKELAASFGVGRNTIREAIRSLASRNIVEVKRGLGCFISDKKGVSDDPLGFSLLSNRDRLVKDLLQVRMIVEPQIALLAAQNATEKDLQKLWKACAAVEEDIQNGISFAESDEVFHAAIAACTHNTVIARLIPIISEGVYNFSDTVQEQEYTQTLRSHRDIYNAIQEHKPYEALLAMQYHIMYNRQRYLNQQK